MAGAELPELVALKLRLVDPLGADFRQADHGDEAGQEGLVWFERPDGSRQKHRGGMVSYLTPPLGKGLRVCLPKASG